MKLGCGNAECPNRTGRALSVNVKLRSRENPGSSAPAFMIDRPALPYRYSESAQHEGAGVEPARRSPLVDRRLWRAQVGTADAVLPTSIRSVA